MEKCIDIETLTLPFL